MGADLHQLRAGCAHHLGADAARLLPDAVDGAHGVGHAAQAGLSRLFDDLRAAEQGRVLGPLYLERDRLVADLLAAGDPQHRDGLPVAREASLRDRRGVLAAQGDAGLLDRVPHGRRVGADGAGPAVRHDGDRALGPHVQREALTADPPGTRGGDVRALLAHPQLSERPGHRARRRPHHTPVAVEGQPYGPGVAHGDLVATGDLLVRSGRDHVVGADLDAFLGQQLGDVVGEGVQRAGLAVHAQLDRLVLGDERRGAARQEGDDQGLGKQPADGAVARALDVPSSAPACGPAVGAGTSPRARSGTRLGTRFGA